MPTALILGASRGIAREYVRQLRAQGWRVFATARDDADLRSEGAEALKLDVTKPDSLADIGWQFDGERLPRSAGRTAVPSVTTTAIRCMRHKTINREEAAWFYPNSMK